MSAVPRGPRRMGFREGGWVVLLAALLATGVMAWALWGVFTGRSTRGDGHTVESYGFDLDGLRTDGGSLVASGQPRDFLQPLDEPGVMPGHEMLAYNAARRGKYVVSGDRVVGVVVDGVARAYPVRLLNAHEVINDTVAGVPIAVTFSPLCDAAVAFDRRVAGRTLVLGVSGLLLDNNLVMYDRGERPSLWSQLGAAAIAGPMAGTPLRMLPEVQVCTWKHWLAAHPRTEVVLPGPDDDRRMKGLSYSRYLLSPRLEFPAARWTGATGLEAKTPVVVLRHGDASVELLLRDAAAGMPPFRLGDATVEVDAQAQPASVLFRTQDGSPLLVLNCLHFARVCFRIPPTT